MDQMHPTMERLYLATGEFKPPIRTQAEMAAALNESSQTVYNWEVRGISQRGANKAQALLGINSTWILDGIGVAVASAEAIHQRQILVAAMRLVRQVQDTAIEAVSDAKLRVISEMAIDVVYDVGPEQIMQADGLAEGVRRIASAMRGRSA